MLAAGMHKDLFRYTFRIVHSELFGGQVIWSIGLSSATEFPLVGLPGRMLANRCNSNSRTVIREWSDRKMVFVAAHNAVNESYS